MQQLPPFPETPQQPPAEPSQPGQPSSRRPKHLLKVPTSTFRHRLRREQTLAGPDLARRLTEPLS